MLSRRDEIIAQLAESVALLLVLAEEDLAPYPPLQRRITSQKNQLGTLLESALNEMTGDQLN